MVPNEGYDLLVVAVAIALPFLKFIYTVLYES